MKKATLHTVPIVTFAMLAMVHSAALAHPHGGDDPSGGHSHSNGYVHENGIGPDPDNDTNPATDTSGISLSGDAADAANDPPYDVITFEADELDHGEKIINEYKDEFGVTFSNGLTRQICEGQRRFQYDSICTYEAAPSGKFAAGYRNDLNRPLEVNFSTPVCVVTMAIYPTGAKEGEPFELTINAWSESGAALPVVKVDFEWTKETVRWRHMAGAFYLGEPAKKVSIGMRSKDGSQARDVLRFLIDDLAFTHTECAETLSKFKSIEEKAGAGVDLSVEGNTETGDAAVSVSAP